MINDPLQPGSEAPFYDCITVAQFHDIVCIRPNNAPRANAPAFKYFVNRFVVDTEEDRVH
jgi:hypothetical protein